MAKTIFRADNCAFTKNPALIKSVKYLPADVATAIENGQFVAIGGLVTGEREVHKATAPTATSTYFGIVCTPELEYAENGYHGLDTYENEADQVLRVGILTKGDIYSATLGGFDKAPVVGNLVELQADTKAKVVTTATADSTQVGKVIEIETVGRFTFYVVEVQ